MYSAPLITLEFKGRWRCLSEVPIPTNHSLIKSLRLVDYYQGYYERLIIYYDDFGPFNIDNRPTESITTRGTIKEALEKSSILGRIIEIGITGHGVYCVVID